MIKSVGSFILIPFRVLIMPDIFFAGLRDVTKLEQLVKPLLFLVIMHIGFISLGHFVRCFGVGLYDFDYIITYLFGQLIPSVGFVIFIVASVLGFSFSVLILFILWRIMGSKASYLTSFQAFAYASISLLMLIACDFFVEIVWNYKYSALYSVVFFWGIYILIVLSKQVHKIERWDKRITIGVISVVIMIPFHSVLWAIQHIR